MNTNPQSPPSNPADPATTADPATPPDPATTADPAATAAATAAVTAVAAAPPGSTSVVVAAATIAGAAMAAAFTATLFNQESTALYAACAAVAGIGLATILAAHARQRFAQLNQPQSWSAIAPVGIVFALLGIAASGASCGVACIAWGAPAASLTMFAPEINHRLRRLRPLKSSNR